MLIPTFRVTTSSKQSFLLKFELRMGVVKIFKLIRRHCFFALVDSKNTFISELNTYI